MASNGYWYACMGLSGLAALALLALLLLYVRHMRRAPSTFSKGLVAFAGLFFLEAAGSIGVWANLSGEYDADVAIPMMLLRGVELAGVAVLLYVSWE